MSLYPDSSQQWNVFSVILFSFWVLVPFIYLRKRFGYLRGGFYACLFSFTFVSIFDEVPVFMNLGYYGGEMGWPPPVFIYRWTWKTFFTYFTVKEMKKAGLLGNMIKFDKIYVAVFAAWMFYQIFVNRPAFGPYNFRSTSFTLYPRWFIYLLSHIVGWTLMTILYFAMWRPRNENGF